MRSMHETLRRCELLANGEKHTPPHDHNHESLKSLNDVHDNEGKPTIHTFNPPHHDHEGGGHHEGKTVHRFYKGLNAKGEAPTRGNVPYNTLVTQEKDLQTAIGWGVYPGQLVNALKLLGLETVRDNIRRVFQRRESQVRNRGAFLTKCLINEARLKYQSYTFGSLDELCEQIDARARYGGQLL